MRVRNGRAVVNAVAGVFPTERWKGPRKHCGVMEIFYTLPGLLVIHLRKHCTSNCTFKIYAFHYL